jgi:hypothetical protein
MSGPSYRDRASRYDSAARDEQKRIRVLSNARFALFIIAIIGLWLLRGTAWFWVVAVVAGAVFVILVKRHRAARDRLQWQ